MVHQLEELGRARPAGWPERRSGTASSFDWVSFDSDVSSAEPPFQLKFYLGRDLRYGDVPLSKEVRVGRSRDNHLVLNDGSVSRHHATFLLEQVEGAPPVVLLRDEGSRNGCVLNGRPVRGTDVVIKPGDCIQIGTFLVDLVPTAPRRPAELKGTEGDKGDIFVELSPSNRAALPDERLNTLYELSQKVDGLDSGELLAVTAASITSSLPFEVLYLFLEEENGTSREFACTPGGPCDPAAISVSRSLVQKSHGDGLAILAGTGGIQSADPNGTKIFNSLKSAISVPLVTPSRVIGAIYASSTSDRVYTKDDLQFLILVSSIVAGRIASRRAVDTLRHEKEKLEKVLSGLQEAVLLLDADFRILRLNSAALQIFAGRDVTGLGLIQALDGYDRNFELESLSIRSTFEIAERVSPSEANEAVHEIPRVYEGTIARSDSSGPGGWRYVVCLHDATQARYMERTKSLFVNRLAHKIVTPLTVVTGVNFLVAEHMGRLNDPELSQLLEQSLKESEQCAALIRQFVDYTAFSFRGRAANIKWDLCSVEDLVCEALASTSELISRRNFQIVTVVVPGAEKVYGDREQLPLVFYHLIQNAAKFGRVGGKVEIRAELSGGLVKVSFRDDGPGIPASEMKNVGQMLYQVDPHNTGEVPGAGFGLWLVREIARCHGGTMRISSPADAEGRGTLVEVLLPSAPQAEGYRDPPTDSLSKVEATEVRTPADPTPA